MSTNLGTDTSDYEVMQAPEMYEHNSRKGHKSRGASERFSDATQVEESPRLWHALMNECDFQAKMNETGDPQVIQITGEDTHFAYSWNTMEMEKCSSSLSKHWPEIERKVRKEIVLSYRTAIEWSQISVELENCHKLRQRTAIVHPHHEFHRIRKWTPQNLSQNSFGIEL